MTAPSSTSPADNSVDVEAISALRDGELADSQLADRLQADPEARAIAEAYAKVDAAVLRALACPADQEQAIVAASVRRSRESGKPAPILLFLQIAAGIAAVAIASLAIRVVTTPDQPAPEVATVTIPEASADAPLVATAPERPAVSPADVFAGNATVRLQDIRLVSAGSDAPRPTTTASQPSPADSAISGSVRHVWLVKDATQPLKALRPMLNGNQDTLDSWIAQNRDSYRLQFELSDRDLQGLVNQFDALGFSLLSPEAPQPKVIGEANFDDVPVLYEVHFVEK